MCNKLNLSDFATLARKQRVFRARQKINLPGYISHITQRAAGREPLFLEDSDYLTMLGLLKDVSERFELNFYALCLMPNHIHILVEPQQKNLSQAMHSIFSRYARRFNKKYERKGHIFGGPYRQAICLDDDYLLTASVYIHLNPLKARIVEKATEYKWSSCSLYCSENITSSFVDPSIVLNLIDQDQKEAKYYYNKIIQKSIDMHPDNPLEQEGIIEIFLTKLAERFPWLFNKIKNKKQDPNQQYSILSHSQLDELIKQIHSNPKKTKTATAQKYMIKQLLARGYNKKQISERLGIARKTVYNILKSI